MSKFLCPRCPKQFQSENNLKRHLIKMHGVERRMKGKPEAKTLCELNQFCCSCDKDIRIRELEGVLSDIRKHYEKRPDFCSYLPDGTRNWYKIGVLYRVWLEELGVLLPPDPFTEKAQPKNEKFRCDEFGDCNMSDTCQQCPSNEECSRETSKKAKGLDQKTEGDKK